MRLSEREITDQAAIESIIRSSLVCRLGLLDGNRPYIVPLCFGYQDRTLYFHGAREGKKIDLLTKNPNVCFEFDLNSGIKKAEKACKWGISYQSVIGSGKASLVDNVDEKKEALGIIMRQYGDGEFSFPDNITAKTAIIKIDIEEMTGKRSK
jgi:nitroimidazol reductase NimA-like FMN-containing flavoprotein (pyridoxamine 5'-phosphate oxidase superfamily)